MGIVKDRKKLEESLGIVFSGTQLDKIRDLVKFEKIDLIEAGKKILDEDTQSDEDLLKLFNSFGNIDYINWEDENTRKVISEIYTSKISYQSRDFRNYLESRGQSTKTIFRDTSNTFFNIINKIEDNRLFWVIFGWFYQQYELTSLRLKDFENCLSDRRFEVGFYERSLLGNVLQTVYYSFFSVQENKLTFDSIDEAKQKIINDTKSNEQFFYKLHGRKEFNDLVKKNNDEEIKIYRGFKVDIRDREKRIFDKENKKQLLGLGLSYSLNRERCIFFTTRWSNFDTFMRILHTMEKVSEKDGRSFRETSIYEDLLERGFRYEQFFNDKKYRDEFLSSDVCKYFVEDFERYRSKNNLMDNLHILNDFENYEKENTRGYIGEYNCLRKDIVFYSDYNNEKEVVVQINKVKMLNYKVVTFSQSYKDLDNTNNI
ncbi:hypothetical protein OAT23_03435 [Candidatus Pelagibacter sp.]|nr:hypothetical protein [Candidatus Pelagibacter sp.]